MTVIRTQPIHRWGAIALVIASLSACTATPTAIVPETSEVPTTTAESAESETQGSDRIVALTTLTADLVQTLDDEALVGMPGGPLTEDPRFDGITVVSEGRIEPDVEAIVALEPDLVIGAGGFHDKVLARLDELGIAVLTVDVTSWDDLKALTTDLAQRTAADPAPLMARYDACLAQAPASGPEALVLVSRQPLLSPNRDSWAGDFLAQFNIQNVTAALQGDSPFEGYITLPEEKVIVANPDTLIVVDTGEDLLTQLKADAFWGELDATQGDRVYSFNYFGLINPGSLASIEATCAQLAQLAP